MEVDKLVLGPLISLLLALKRAVTSSNPHTTGSRARSSRSRGRSHRPPAAAEAGVGPSHAAFEVEAIPGLVRIRPGEVGHPRRVAPGECGTRAVVPVRAHHVGDVERPAAARIGPRRGREPAPNRRDSLGGLELHVWRTRRSRPPPRGEHDCDRDPQTASRRTLSPSPQRRPSAWPIELTRSR